LKRRILLETRSGMSRKKVTVVGGGFVGSTTAQRIVDLELADVVLTDILDGPPAGKALDMMESGRSCMDLEQQLHAVEKAIGNAKKELIISTIA